MTHYIIVYYVIKFGRGPVEMLGLSAACQRRRGDFGHAYIYIYIYMNIYEYIYIYVYTGKLIKQPGAVSMGPKGAQKNSQK